MSMWVMDDYLIAQYGNVQALTSATWFVSRLVSCVVTLNFSTRSSTVSCLIEFIQKIR